MEAKVPALEALARKKKSSYCRAGVHKFFKNLGTSKFKASEG
jgi:hypothetical protein